jgi:hypothetical protein
MKNTAPEYGIFERRGPSEKPARLAWLDECGRLRWARTSKPNSLSNRTIVSAWQKDRPSSSTRAQSTNSPRIQSSEYSFLVSSQHSSFGLRKRASQKSSPIIQFAQKNAQIGEEIATGNPSTVSRQLHAVNDTLLAKGDSRDDIQTK